MQTLNKKGLTLTELIVSTIMIAIVMLGIAAFSVAIKHIQESTNKSTILTMQMAGAMSHITKNATLAIGYIGDPGIYTGDAAGGNANPYVCFREDRASTPASYADDFWNMYVVDRADLVFCSIPDHIARIIYDQPSAATVAAACMLDPSHYVVLQNVINDHLAHPTQFWLQHDSTPSVLEFFIEITLSTLYDPNNSTIHPTDNPVMTFTTSISPPAHSWN